MGSVHEAHLLKTDRSSKSICLLWIQGAVNVALRAATYHEQILLIITYSILTHCKVVNGRRLMVVSCWYATVNFGKLLLIYCHMPNRNSMSSDTIFHGREPLQTGSFGHSKCHSHIRRTYSAIHTYFCEMGGSGSIVT